MSASEIINLIFGGQVDASKIISILVGAYAVVKSITEWIAKKKLLKATNEQSQLAAELKSAREENKELKKAIGKFGDIVITAYLSSNTVPVEVKRELGKFGSELNKIAEVPLAETTVKLVDIVQSVVPVESLNEHKEEITEAAKLAEDVIDSANELAQNAIDKISI